MTEQQWNTLLALVDGEAFAMQLQCQSFSSIDGILLLDDLIGFLGKEDMEVFVVPFFQELFQATGKRVNFLHNDAHGQPASTRLSGAQSASSRC